MTYPALPFENQTWRITHHQGILTPTVLNALLFAASTYQSSRDPAHEINTYLIANHIVPPNIRDDTQQTEIWRDYQQLLPELGLIPSSRRSRIQLSPIGLSFLDGGIGFTELMTIQAFRWQYPNGHNTQKSPGEKSGLNFSAQQAASGILIKPAVLIWQVLDALQLGGLVGSLSAQEVELYLIPARTHQNVPLIVEAIRRNRALRLVMPSGQSKRRRNASDWIKRLGQTFAFTIDDEEHLSLSSNSKDNRETFRQFMVQLCEPSAWWIYTADGSQADSWNYWYGSFDSRQYPIPRNVDIVDYGSDPEPEDEGQEDHPREVALTEYQWRLDGNERRPFSATISSVYSAELSNSAHRLHDSMIRLIAETCSRKSAKVFTDPATLDLLIQLDTFDLLIEVKSATSRNLAHKVRSALGQVTYYDFLRSRQSIKPRRRGVAMTLGVAAQHWSKAFLTDYLDVDYVTLNEGKLLTYSRSAEVSALIS